jgi:ABC-type glycerol-3-phosphate transport system permease component
MKHLARNAMLYVVLVAIAAMMLTPMVWLVAASIKGPDDLFHYTFFAPRASTINFEILFKRVPFARYFLNSCFIACTAVLVQLFFSSLGGFALARYQFAGKRMVVILMLATLLIPGQVLMAPLYELIYRLGLVDSYAGLIVPGAVSVFGMFLFWKSMLQIPEDLMQAGRIDGCSEFRLYWNIAIPVSRPMIGAFTLLAFMGAWNSFLWPQIILHTTERFTLPIGLNQMVSLYAREYGAMLAGTLLAVLPVVGMFFLLQKEFIAGLTSGAMKG